MRNFSRAADDGWSAPRIRPQIIPLPGHIMNTPVSHIEPSKHSTDEVDEFLRHIEKNIDDAEGAGSPAIKPDKALVDAAKPIEDHSKKQK